MKKKKNLKPRILEFSKSVQLLLILYNFIMDPKFNKIMYLIAFLALIVAALTIYAVLNEINLFFTERIKI